MNDRIVKFKEEINGKRVSVIGLGVSNIPAIIYLNKLGAKIIARDKNEEIPEKLQGLDNIEFVLGENDLQGLKDSDYIFRSPGVKPWTPEIVEAVEAGVILTSEMETFIHLTDATVIAITGSDGKTTTTTLTSLFLKEAGENVYVGGNIGTPLLDKVEEITSDDYVVLELSSVQLMTMQEKTDRAAITNVSPNHLDYHHDYEEYIRAKSNVFNCQESDGILVLNEDNEFTPRYEAEAKGIVRKFSLEKETNGVYYRDGAIYSRVSGVEERIMSAEDIKIVGMHNVANVCTAASLVIDITGIMPIVHVCQTFGGVEHRMEFVREINGVKWYNDSIASSPTRTIAGLKSFKEPIVLIAGGYDKHIPYDVMGPYLMDKVKLLILVGTTSPKIREAAEIEAQKRGVETMPIVEFENLKDAVDYAKENTTYGDVVAMSPASASFDLYKNFEVRGNLFKEYVNQI